MAIRGDLLSADLSNVFQMLALNRKSGQLTVQEQGNLLNKRRLYVKEDRVALHEPAPERPIVALLVEMGALSYEQYRDVLEKSVRYQSEPVRLLQQMGLLDDAQMDRVRHRVEEEGVLEVFLWRNITFELDENAAPPVNGTPYFGIDQLIMESARRQDEWSQFVEMAGVNRQIYIRSGHVQSTDGLDLEAIPHIVLDHVDGVRGSREIVEETGLPRYFVDLSLRGLHDAGYIEPLGLSELITTGDRLVEHGHHASALRLFRTALQFDRRNLTLHQRLARAHLDTGRIAKSGAHYRFCAMSLLAAGRRREALGIYQNVLKLLPTDFRTLERCLELLSQEGSVTNKDDEEVCESARKLLNFYLDTQQDEKALAIIEKLQRLGDEDEELINVAARLHLRTGQTEKAVRAFMSQAQARQSAGDLTGALELYRTLSGVDQGNRHIYQTRISEINRIQENARRRKRRGRMLLVAALVGVVAALGYGAYALAAASELSRLPDDDPMDLDAARRRIQRLEATRAAYPLTPAALEVGDRIERVEDWMRRVHETEQAAIRKKRQAKDNAIKEAGRILDEAIAEMERVDLEAALEKLRKAIATVDEAKAEWAQRPQAEQHISDIETYIREGSALMKQGLAALEAGDTAKAHAALKKVIGTYLRLPSLAGKTIELPVRILAFPPQAKIEVSNIEGPVDAGMARLLLVTRHDRLLTVKVSLDGFGTETRQMDPMTGWELSVVLDRTDGKTVTVEEPVASMHTLPDGRVVLVARNGKVGFMQMAGDNARSWERGSTLLSVRAQPAIGPSGVLVAAERGLLRLVDRIALGQSWTTRLRTVRSPETVLSPTTLGSDFVVGVFRKDGEGALARVQSRGGAIAWEIPFRGPVGPIAANARGVAVVDAEGALHLIDPATGKTRRTLPGPFGVAPAQSADGRLLVYSAEQGVMSMAWDGSDARTELKTSGPLVGRPIDIGGTIIAAHRGRLVLGRGEDTVTLPVGTPIVDLVPGPLRCAARLEDGRVLVVDPSSRTIMFAVRGPVADLQAPVTLTRTHVVFGAGARKLLLVPLE